MAKASPISRVRRFVADQRGMALVEFSIAMPLALLMFLAMLQYLQIVRASQHGNYAAYAAARVYAVRFSVDGDAKAKQLATRAAALALAPVAEIKPGEIPIIGGTPAGLLPPAITGAGRTIARLALGYGAALLRLNPSVGGGQVAIRVEGEPKQVHVEIDYPQPVYLPGLAGLWNYLYGEKIYTAMAPLRDGLGGMPGTLLPFLEDWESIRADFARLGIRLPDIPSSLRITPYINVRSKCAIGLEEWGEHKPRLRATAENGRDADAQSEFDQAERDTRQADRDAKDAQERAKRDSEALQAASNRERTACSSWQAAQNNLTSAQRNYDRVFNNPASTAAQKQTATQNLNLARSQESTAHQTYSSAHSERIQRQNDFQSRTGSYVDYSFECN